VAVALAFRAFKQALIASRGERIQAARLIAKREGEAATLKQLAGDKQAAESRSITAAAEEIVRLAATKKRQREEEERVGLVAEDTAAATDAAATVAGVAAAAVVATQSECGREEEGEEEEEEEESCDDPVDFLRARRAAKPLHESIHPSTLNNQLMNGDRASQADVLRG
jgi:hypothetical protein